MAAPPPPASARRPPAVVWALALLGLLMSMSASLVLPTYLGFDEPMHVDMVVSLASGDGWPGPGERGVSLGVARSSSLYYGAPLKTRPLDAALSRVAPRGQRPTLDRLGGDVSSGGIPNQIVQHPPLYYGIEAVVLRGLGAQDWSYDRLVALLRLVTAVLVAPLPLLVWAIANRLRTAPSVAVSAAALSLAVPGLTRVSGLVNNDGFVVLTVTALLLGLVHVATGDLSRRTAVVVGVLTGLALLSKGFALPMPLLVVLAYAIGARAALVRFVQAVLPLAVALAVGFVAGGFWWLRNLVLYGALQPNGYGAAALAKLEGKPRAADNPPVLHVYLEAAQDRLARTFWAGVGIASQPTLSKTAATVLCVLVLLAAAIAIGVGVRGRGQRAVLLLLLLPLPLALAIVVDGSYGEYVDHARLPGLQGRYLYLAVGGLAVLAAVAWDRLLGPLRRTLPLLSVLVVLGLQGQQLARLLRRLWTADGHRGLLPAIRHLDVLSPWPDAITNLVLMLTAAAALGVLLLVAKGSLRPVRSLSRRTRPRPAADA